MHYQAIKYLSRLSSINSKRLLHQAYNLEIQKTHTGETAHIENTNKLTFLKSLKEVYKSEKYLQIKYFDNRRATTKLRTSNHNFAVELGR